MPHRPLHELFYRMLDQFSEMGMQHSNFVNLVGLHLEERSNTPPNAKAVAALEEAAAYLELDEEGTVR